LGGAEFDFPPIPRPRQKRLNNRKVLKMRKLFSNKKGQGLVEYGLIIAGVALICAAAISIFGHKTSDLISAVATILPGASPADNAPIVSGRLIETTPGSEEDAITLDVEAIAGNSGSGRLDENVRGTGGVAGGFGGLILDLPVTP